MKQKLVMFAIIAAVLFALGFRAGHPVDGLSSAMGSAKSGIVIYKKAGEYVIGQKVVVDVAGQGLETGIIKSATKETVDVDTKAAFVRVNQKDVHGRLMVVVPFFGTIIGLVPGL
jgi:hypothetical protein